MKKMEDNAMNEQESGEKEKAGLVKKIQGGQGEKTQLNEQMNNRRGHFRQKIHKL